MTLQPSAADPVLSKSAFAREIGVSPARVSQYIGEKKLSGEALVGEGRNAQIRVGVAKFQLRQLLDIGQRFGNGLDTRLDGPPAAAAPLADKAEVSVGRIDRGAEFALPLPPTAAETVEDKIKAAKLEAQQRANRKAAEDEAARAGRYVMAEDVTRSMGRALARQIAAYEGSLGELATAIAAKFSLSQRDVLHLLRFEFRAWRDRQAVQFQEEAATMPRLVEDDIDDVEVAVELTEA